MTDPGLGRSAASGSAPGEVEADGGSAPVASTCLIRYRYPGTTNGRSVGDVYVTGPHFGTGVWSHTYRVTEAARFTEAEAQRRLQMHGWARNGGHIVPLTEATDLPDATGAA